MRKIIVLKGKAPTGRDHKAARFGDCPECGKQDGYVNVGKSYFLV